DRSIEIVGVALGPGEVQRRDDVRVEDPRSALAEGLSAGCRDGMGSAIDHALEPSPQRYICRVANAEDDREAAVRAVAGAALEHGSHVLGVGPGHGEDVRLQGSQLRRAVETGDDCNEPRGKDRPAPAQHEPGPTSHAYTLPTLRSPRQRGQA